MSSLRFKHSFSLFCCLVSLTVVSCGPGKKENSHIDTDIVNIPSNGSDNENLPEMTFESSSHDFGTITDGEKVSYSFRFKNTGKSDLVVTSAKGSCGCTVADPPKKPIPPGEDGYITVTFDSSGKTGYQKKEVTIVTNCQPNTKIVTFTANVLKAEDRN